MFKTNDKKDRVDYSSVLIPPDGYTLNFAVGSTYSLDLESLTLVCISLGLNEETDSTLINNPVCMLNALQKVTSKMLIFCEAGQIKIRGDVGPLSLMLEKMIVPVALENEKGVYPSFHPKTWILQYVNKKGEYIYRFAILSRNLTFDRSWDICFSMDSINKVDTSENTKQIINYLEFLKSQITTSVQDRNEKINRIKDLCHHLENVSFTTGSKEFNENFEILPLGIGEKSKMSEDPLLCKNKNSKYYTFHNLVVFSPFVSDSLIEEWNKLDRSLKGTKRTLITRKSELSKFDENQSNNFNIYTLRDEVVDGEGFISEENGEKQKQDIHAKIYIREKYNDVYLYLGSMNATYSAINRNVEMMIKLHTTKGKYNSEDFLKDIFCGDPENDENPFEKSYPTQLDENTDENLTHELEKVIKDICRFKMNAKVTENNGKYDIDLTIQNEIPNKEITITPIRRNNPVKLENKMSFKGLDILQVSEFYYLEVKEKDVSVKRVIMIKTDGIPKERESGIVNEIINDTKAFAEYVSFILGDYLVSFVEERTLQGSGKWEMRIEDTIPLYEKMLKTSFEDPQKLSEIGYLLDMIKKEGIVPKEFRELYEVFKKTLKLK